jgi:hypothetical protein
MPRKLKVDKLKARLTLDQELALAFGGNLIEQFVTPADARRTWFEHCDRMTAYFGAGSRPVGFWVFEAHEHKPTDSATEAARLAQLGHLSASEIAEIRSTYATVWPDVEAALNGDKDFPPEDIEYVSARQGDVVSTGRTQMIGRTDDLERDIGYVSLLLHLPLPPAMDAPDLKFHKEGDTATFKRFNRIWSVEDDNVTELVVSPLDDSHELVAWTEYSEQRRRRAGYFVRGG